MSNWSNTRPDIPDTWKGNMTDAQRVLGQPGKPIAYKTLDKWIETYKEKGYHLRRRITEYWRNCKKVFIAELEKDNEKRTPQPPR